MSSQQLARLIAALADEKQATDLVAFEVGDLVGYTDVLLICTARNERLAKAIHDEVHARLKHEWELLPSRAEGLGENRWILLDYGVCVVHIFVPETRERYRLEQLWGEAPELELGLGAAPEAVRGPA